MAETKRCALEHVTDAGVHIGAISLVFIQRIVYQRRQVLVHNNVLNNQLSNIVIVASKSIPLRAHLYCCNNETSRPLKYLLIRPIGMIFLQLVGNPIVVAEE